MSNKKQPTEESKFKNLSKWVYLSCFLSLINLVFRFFIWSEANHTEEKSEPAKTEISVNQTWDVAIIRKMDMAKSPPDIRALLQNMGVTNENQVIFGFLAQKVKEDSWNERIFKDEKINTPGSEKILEKQGKR